MEADDVLPGLENVVRRHGDGLSDEGDASLRRRLDGRRRERSISPARVRDPHIDGSLRPLPQGDALRNVALGADTVLDRRIEQQVAREVPPTQTDIRSQNVNTAAVQHVAREEPPVQTDVRSQNVQSQQALDGALLQHRTDVTNLIIQLGRNPVTRAKFGALVHDIFVMWVRQCHPAMKNANEQDCLARAWDCMHFGLFDPHLEHLAKKSSESISRSNDVVVAAFPVRRGMILDDELQSLVQTVPSEKEQRGGTPFRARIPSPEEFSGNIDGSRISTLKTLDRWIESVDTSAQLAGLEERNTVLFAAKHLKGPAQTWWNAWSEKDSCTTMMDLREGLTIRFVGPNPFELLCEELEDLRLVKFGKFETFRATFVQVVAAMRSYAPSEDRVWPDTVLIDKLLVALSGTKYWEGVVLDPQTNHRPNTFEEALSLCDAQHAVLLHRKEALGQRSDKRQSVTETPNPPPRKQDGGKGRQDKRRKRDGDDRQGRGHEKRTNTGGEANKRETMEKFMKKFGLSEEVVLHRMEKVKHKGKDVYPCMKCGRPDHRYVSCTASEVKKNI